MRYAGINQNDFINGKGVCVSFWAQGCPFHCKGCHNPETWDFEGGLEADEDWLINTILSALSANNIQRNFSILGGEPSCPENITFTYRLLDAVRQEYPSIQIFLWTGYTVADIIEKSLLFAISDADVLITGPYDCTQRDITLPLRGSRNQQIWVWDEEQCDFVNQTENFD